MDPYYDANGTLYVWTGTGYHAIPRVAAADVGDLSYAATSSLPSDQDWSAYAPEELSAYVTPGYSGWGISNMDPYGSLSAMDPGVNFKLQEGGTQDAFNYWLKSGDKEGSEITFQRDGDWYNPTFDGVQYWDTNDADKRVIPLSIMLGGGAALYGGAMGAGAGLTNSMTGAGGTALAGSADAALWGGLGAAEGLGAAGTGLTLTGSAINPTTYSMTPSALMGDGLLSSGVGGAAGASSLIPEGLRNVWDKIPSGLQSQLIKGGMTLAGGLLGGGGESSGGSGMASGPRSIAPAITPKMYGEGPTQGLLGASMGPMGNTETERRMRQQYMPSLLGGGLNPWGF